MEEVNLDGKDFKSNKNGFNFKSTMDVNIKDFSQEEKNKILTEFIKISEENEGKKNV